MIAGSGKGRSTNVELGERPLPYLGNSNQPVKGALASKLLKSRGDGHDAKEPGMPPVAQGNQGRCLARIDRGAR